MAKRKALTDGTTQATDKRNTLTQVGTDDGLDAETRLSIVGELCSIRGVAKVGLSKTLKMLYDKGLLKDALVRTPTDRSYRRQVQNSIEREALYAQTPYGTLLRALDLPTGEKKQRLMYYVHPKALIYHLCFVSAQLFALIKSAVNGANGLPLRIVLFLDGINPGNPMAPDPQRLLQAIYWTFLELPNWFLRRKDSWWIFSLVREMHVEKMPGKMAELTKMVMEIFFSDGDMNSFKFGLVVTSGGESIDVDVTFGGFMCDEKGHKSNLGIKGQAGNTPCFDCYNIKNRWCELEDGQQYFWDPDLSKRKKLTRNHLKIVLDRISTAPSAGERDAIEKRFGINWVPTGVLFSSLMFSVIDPERCYLRDWMHTLVSNGVAGAEIALMVQALSVYYIGTSILQKYAATFQFPHKVTGNPERFFKDELMTSDHVKHFASDCLTMVYLLYGFLVDKVLSNENLRSELGEHVECFKHLFIIICILKRGTMNQTISTRLKKIIVAHARLFLKLYEELHATPKFHHMYHLPDDLLWMLQCLSCFPTERKNKDALELSNATDRTVEKTSVINFLQQTLSHWAKNGCQESYLHGNPRSYALGGGVTLFQSSGATCQGGEIKSGDMVSFSDGSIGKVISFSQCDGDERIYAQAEVHELISGFDFQLGYEVLFVDVSMIVEAVCWKTKPRSIFAIVPMYS